MRALDVFLLLSPLMFVSCENKVVAPPSEIKNDSPEKNILTNDNRADSLDTDTSEFITTGFPDTIKKIIYPTNQRLLELSHRSYIRIGKKDSIFSMLKFKQIMSSNGFYIDSNSSNVSFFRHSFNKREHIDYEELKKGYRLLIGNEQWIKGKKYKLWESWEFDK